MNKNSTPAEVREARIAAMVAKGRWSERQATRIVDAQIADETPEVDMVWNEMHEAWVPKS